MSKPKHQDRYNFDFEPDSSGLIFINPKNASMTDLSSLNVLHASVDTVRQLYRGKLTESVLSLFENSGLCDFAGYQWHAARIGRDSGYQFKLQNSDLGVILLIKNFNCSATDSGPHLKIEVSPHLLDDSSPAKLQTLLDHLANQVLTDAQPNQCAVHVAVDLQGWFPESLIDRMSCRSQRVRDISGIDSIHYHGDATVYGRGQSYLWGSASGLQCAIYNKSVQAQVTDKLDYWRSVWSRSYVDLDTPAYNPDLPVWRVELRFHHSIIQQFAEGSFCTDTGSTIDTRTFAEIAPHLSGLFRYGLNSFRLLSDVGLFDPVWSYLMTNLDINTGAECLFETTEYKRYYKTASGFTGKNVDLFMGNMVSLLARERVGASKAFTQLQGMSFWPVIVEHFEAKGKSERDIYCWLRDKLTERIIRWGVAV